MAAQNARCCRPLKVNPVKYHQNGYVGNRVLKLNVGFLLAAGPGKTHDTGLDIPAIRVADDVDLDYLRGVLRLSRTKEGILVQGDLRAGFQAECYRCLTPVRREAMLELEELYAYPLPDETEFSLADDGILDLSPLIRAEMLIEEEHRVLCRDDCKGLCVECGENLNLGECACIDVAVDPRLAQLKILRDQIK